MTPQEPRTPRDPRAGRRGRTRRRLGGAVRLLAALLLMGGLYTAFAPGLAAQEEPVPDMVAYGKELYDNHCITCHGRNGEGVDGRGPSLIGVGAAAVEFQVGTGRMPAARQEAQAPDKPPLWEGEELERVTRALAAYVQSQGGGPQVPDGADLGAGGDPGSGGELYRLNCSSCHGYSGGGGALSSGAFAPELTQATDRQIWAAMLSGPQNMPVFGDNQLTEDEKRDIIAFINYVEQDPDRGGVFNLGRLGPATEGLAVFLVGIVAVVLATLWIAGKS